MRELEAANGVIALSATRPSVSDNGDTSNFDPRLPGFVGAPRVDPLPLQPFQLQVGLREINHSLTKWACSPCRMQVIPIT